MVVTSFFAQCKLHVTGIIDQYILGGEPPTGPPGGTDPPGGTTTTTPRKIKFPTVYTLQVYVYLN